MLINHKIEDLYNVNLHWANDQELHYAAVRISTSLGLILVDIKNYNIGLQYDYWTYNIGQAPT